MPDRLLSIRETLEANGQAHLLRFYDELDATKQATLLDGLERIDFETLDAALKSATNAGGGVPSDLAPASYYPSAGEDADEFRTVGEEAIRGGRVAAFTVAGGQGTRLGWNGPKGTYPATPVTGKPLFRLFAEQLIAVEKRYGVVVPWYIMTSPENDAATRSFFQDNNCFGLTRKNIFMFPQGTMPSVEAESGRLILADKHLLATNPDGHGGSLRALRASGAIEDMRARGVDQVSYFQVDNPLARAIDPFFIGLHIGSSDSSGEMSSKMVAKTDPAEKVGVFGQSGGKTMVIEYSDLPETLARETDANGRLRYCAGSIAIHVLSVAFVERLTTDAHASGLPYHRALKKVAYLDAETGRSVEPETPNAVKLETFVFDALPLAESSIVLETDRAEEFAPIKNAHGADSAASSHVLQSDRAGRWLAAHGVEVPTGGDGHVTARLEISPLTALHPADLVAADLPNSIAPGEELAL